MSPAHLDSLMVKAVELHSQTGLPFLDALTSVIEIDEILAEEPNPPVWIGNVVFVDFKWRPSNRIDHRRL